MRIALVGDVHGHFNWLYRSIQKYLPNADLILTTGDFGAFRSVEDYYSTKIPKKHMDHNFEYNLWKDKIPVKTIFIGGNHEPNGFLKSLWETQGQFSKLTDNLFFLGYHGATNIGDTLLAGISGNYSPKNFERARKHLDIRRWRHFLKEDLEYIRSLKSMDYLMIHDWFQGMENYFKCKFVNCLSPQLRDLIIEKKPPFVFAGHMHTYINLKLNENTRFISLAILKENTKIIEKFEYNNHEFFIFG